MTKLFLRKREPGPGPVRDMEPYPKREDEYEIDWTKTGIALGAVFLAIGVFLPLAILLWRAAVR